MADKTVRGRFVWHELMTPDSAAAHVFYGKALGWKMQAWERDPSYSMFAAASGPLGAAVAESTQAPHWIAYIGTPDIEATVRQARQLGASVLKDVTIIDAGGRYALLADPHGAKFGVYASDAPAQQEKAPRHGEFSWHELATTDAAAALEFYRQLFGWEPLGKHDMGPMGFYYIFGRNGLPAGGAFDRTADMPGGPAWLGYVRVKDLDKTVAKVKSSGGTLLMGPMEVPGGDWIAQFADPHGALFAAHVVKADRELPQAAPVRKTAAASKAAVSRKSAQSRTKTAGRKTAKKKAAKKQADKKKTVGKVAKRVAAKSAKRGVRRSGKVRAKVPKRPRKRVAASKAAAKKRVTQARKKARRAK